MKKSLILAAVVALVGTAAFYLLGGGQAIEVKLVDRKSYLWIGYNYDGKPNSKAFKELSAKAKELIDGKTLDGTLTAIHYTLTEEEQAQGLVSSFFGVEVPEVPNNLTAGLEIREHACVQALRVEIKANAWVWPRPEKILKAIHEYAQQNNLRLEPFSIEQFVSADKLIVEVPLER